MADSVPAGSILVADDEETFRESTCRLLRNEGFDCHCAQDGDEAVASLQLHRFDLLMADIRMPRNPDFRLVREARALYADMPIILVTGYPSTETAIRSVEMHVAAYLTKPLDIDDLLGRVRKAVEGSRRRQAIPTVLHQLRACLADIEGTQSASLTAATVGEGQVPLSVVRRLAACLSELLDVANESGADWNVKNLCELLDCPHKPVFRSAIVDTIEVLKETRSTFKSKALGELRTKLEGLIGSGQGQCCRD